MLGSDFVVLKLWGNASDMVIVLLLQKKAVGLITISDFLVHSSL